MKSKLLLLLLVICGAQIAEAQISVEDDNTERTVTVISYEAKSSKSRERYMNAVKIGIIDVIYGHQSIYYERSFSKNLSAQVSIGVAHRNFYEDLSQMIRTEFRFSDADFKNSSSYSDNELNDYNNVRKAKLGYSVGINPRFYTNGWGMEDFYVGPSIRYQQNNFKYIKDGLDEKENLKKFSVGLVIGNQNNNKPVCVDYGIGVGYKMISQKRYMTKVFDENYDELPEGIYNFKTNGVNFEIYLTIGGFFGRKSAEKKS